MQGLMENDILTKVTRYNLIRNQRMIYIDVHKTLAGDLAGNFVAVPNLINIIARQEFQGVGQTESAVKNYLLLTDVRSSETQRSEAQTGAARCVYPATGKWSESRRNCTHC